MGRKHSRKLQLLQRDVQRLEKIVTSRKESASRVQRSKILLSYHQGKDITTIARELNISRPTIYHCLKKAEMGGLEMALSELPRSGRPAQITSDDKFWLINLACRKPKELGYAQELWTFRLLSQHVRNNACDSGHPSLARATKSMVHEILNEADIRPQKIRYYLESRDPDFEEKMAHVLCIYKEVQLQQQQAEKDAQQREWVVISVDEKPGIQALEGTCRDLPPVPGKHATYGRDHEYIRHGTMSLIAGIDLFTGNVLGIVRDRHRSREFIEFLQYVNDHYPPDWRIRIIVDNHSAHTSKETRAWLSKHPNRFEFIFTPTHGSWLNLIETFFSKMARTFLRSIRVSSKQELKDRIMQYLAEVNKEPVIFRWKYKMDELV